MPTQRQRPLFIINTPSQAHAWRHIVEELLAGGHDVRILAREYGSTPQLLNSFGFPCTTFKPVGTKVWRLLAVLGHFEKCYRMARGFSPSMVVGFGLDAAVTSAMFRKPCIAFFDDEHTYVQNRLTSMLATWAITPDTFDRTLGKNHIRMRGYKELAYLHPKYFEPDITIYDELKINRHEPFVILRFNLLDAIHDIGMHGLSVSNQLELVREFEKHARVLISPEGSLPRDLERYRLTIPFNRIHHALYYAQLLVSNSCTMTTEAAILGTPAVRIHPIVARATEPKVFAELEKKYELIYSFSETGRAVRKAIDLISKPGIKEEWGQKRQRLLADKIDVNRFILDFIERCPDSGSQRYEAPMSRKGTLSPR